MNEFMECWTECLPQVRQTVLHSWRHLRVDGALYDFISLKITKLLDEHLL